MVLLVLLALWSLSTPGITCNLVKFMPRKSIDAITSWHPNTGREDIQSGEVLGEFRSWKRSLSKKVSMLTVPDSVPSETLTN
jgi:hypothetical protein